MPILRTLTDIQTGLGNLLRRITIENGYATELCTDNVYENGRDPEGALSGDDWLDNFPKAVLQLFGEEYEYFPSNRVHKHATWFIGITDAVVEDELDLVNQKVQAIITDMENAFMSDYQLGGLAISAQIMDNVYDQDYIDRGIITVMFRVRVVYASHRG